MARRGGASSASACGWPGTTMCCRSSTRTCCCRPRTACVDRWSCCAPPWCSLPKPAEMRLIGGHVAATGELTMIIRTAAACAVALAALAGAAQAKTFVYCSEGSPEGFSPMLFTSGTTFDANRPIYDRLLQFKPGTTEVEAGLAEK